MIDSTASATWTDNAPCGGRNEYVPDINLLKSLKALKESCGPLMDTCTTCPFLLECFERVRPKASRFDGVCAARLWVNGRLVDEAAGAPPLPAEKSHAGTCGTSTGVKRHLRLGQKLCGPCRVVAQRSESRKAGQATLRRRPAPEPAAA
ncbi:hypothetical protein AB0H73_23480 [Streptomyces olivoreticuli]